MNRATAIGREAYRAWRRIETRWADNDQYGHVNNTVYYEWFDTAVNAWLIDQGLLRLGPEAAIGLVAETGCTFLRPVTFPEAVEVGLGTARIGDRSVTYQIGIFAEGGDTPSAQGRLVHVCVNRHTHRPTAMPPEWRSALEQIALPASA